MKRMKKLFAILMTMAMVMGLGITGFAAESATIVINGLAQEGTNTVTCYQILKPDVTTDSGYTFADGITQIGSYTNAENFLAANPKDRQDAIRDANKDGWPTVKNGKVSGYTYTATDVDAGYYAAVITNSDPSITYNVVLIGVDYNKATYNQTNGTYTYDVKNATVEATAKYTKIPTTKSVTTTKDKDDNVTELGRIVGYDITSYMPTEGTSSFILVDTLTGAKYNEDSVSITIGGTPISVDSTIKAFDPIKNTMTIDLSTYCNKANVGKKVIISYTVQVTDTYISNTVVPTIPNHTVEEVPPVVLKTGAIELLKKGVDGDANKLNGAKFVVSKDSLYLKKTEVNDEVAYTWVEKKDATTFTTGVDGVDENDGKILIEGLDMGTYHFEEVEAPNGYSINENGVDVTISEGNLTPSANVSATPAHQELTDTKLSELPSTGGMGTTIFTIAGCVIMILSLIHI